MSKYLLLRLDALSTVIVFQKLSTMSSTEGGTLAMIGIQAPSLPVLGSLSTQGNVYVDQYLSGLYFSGFLSMLPPLDSGLCSQMASSPVDSCFLTSCDSACLFLITSIFKILGKG